MRLQVALVLVSFNFATFCNLCLVKFCISLLFFAWREQNTYFVKILNIPTRRCRNTLGHKYKLGQNKNIYSFSLKISQIVNKMCSQQACFIFLFCFISFIGHRNSRLQGERPMGLVQTGKRDPCKAQPLNISMTR
jgi:hypothetical protein